MTIIDRSLIEAKLAAIARFCKELDRAVAEPYETYSEDFINARAAERTLEMLIELAADTIAYLFTVRNLPPPSSYKETFFAAHREGMLSEQLSGKLIGLSSLRNRLVHEYSDKFDPLKAYKGFRAAPEVFREFAEKIFAML
jgi:uncharacterized protein YutE (UPF0331/DUF86 family)